jgi:glycosyltransferase involved in cell wall biosynthesis
MSKNILEVCLSPDLGGLELFMVHSLEFFREKTNAKVVIAPGTKLDDYIKQEKFFIKRNKLLPIIPALSLAKIIDNEEIDFIHFHWTKDIVLVVLAKLLSKRKPKIMQTRNMTMTRFKDDFYHKWLYKNIDIMHAVTHQVKEQLQKFIPKEVCPKIEVVYMGTKINKKLQESNKKLMQKYGIEEDDFIVGIIGRIEEGKGQWIVIKALQYLPKNVKALIVGHTMDEEYLQKLKQEAVSTGVQDKVIFTGFTKAVHEHMQVCDVTVLATPRETFGLVIIESMANGVPVIATNNGGPLEIIEDGVDGLLFDRTVDDLAQKIKQLYEDSALKRLLGKNAYLKVQDKFEQKKQLEKLYGVIDES